MENILIVDDNITNLKTAELMNGEISVASNLWTREYI